MPVDSLVLRIDEIEKLSGKIDTTLFILYDHVNQEYLIRGSRRGIFYPYSFVCPALKDARNFVETTIGLHNRVCYNLMNYNDLPYDSAEITYEYLCERFDQVRNEVVAYDKYKLKYNDSYLNQYLSILRNTFNHYIRT